MANLHNQKIARQCLLQRSKPHARGCEELRARSKCAACMANPDFSEMQENNSDLQITPRTGWAAEGC